MVNRFIKTGSIGALSLAAVIVCLPAQRAHSMSFFDIFDTLTSTVTAIGTSITSVDNSVNQMMTLEQQTVHSLSNLQNVQGNGITGIVGRYRNSVTNVFGAVNYSGSTNQVTALENSMFSSLKQFYSNPTSAPSTAGKNLSAQYRGVYQTLPTPQQVPPSLISAIDMTDAHAQDAMTQADYGDAAAITMIQSAQNLEDQALSTSSGSAPQIEAQALAAAVQSMALQHKMYAAQLRIAAARLGTRSAEIKQAGATNQGIATGLSGILKSN
jgi:hypothetical protein